MNWNIVISWKLLSDALSMLYEYTRPGITGRELNRIFVEYCRINNCKAAFLGFQWFPKALCVSIDDCLVHGIPDDTMITDTSLVKIDVGIDYRGAYTDAAIARWPAHQHIIDFTKWALDSAVSIIKPWLSIYDLGAHIQHSVESQWWSIIRSLTGHGVGKKIHDKPNIYNYAETSAKNQFLKAGMILAIEPITAVTSVDYIIGTNNRNLYTTDGDMWCQREYTVHVTQDWCEVIAGMR